MNRPKKVVRNIIMIVVLLFLFLNRAGLYLTPISAHEHSERSIHYGPSEVMHVQAFDGGKYILGKYDKWVSCNTVNRTLFFFWSFGNQPIGFENDKTKFVDYTWGISHQDYKVYGIINDDKVKKIEITLSNGGILTQSEFYENLFLFTWKSDNNQGYDFDSIRGYDAENNIMFEDKY